MNDLHDERCEAEWVEGACGYTECLCATRELVAAVEELVTAVEATAKMEQ